MSTHPYRAEIIVAGFAHLIWLTLLSLYILGYPITSFSDELSKIDSGLAVILVALIGGLSVYLGNLAEHFFVVISFVVMNSTNREIKCREYADNPDNIWPAKSFFRSMSFAVFAIVLILLIITNNESARIERTIWVIGILLELPTLICWTYLWYIDYKVNG